MKHSLMIVIGAVATMMSFSCASEGVPTQTENILEFKAVLADADETRTAIQSDGTSVWWSPGESINVFYGNQFGGKFTSFNTEAQSTASFRGTWTDFTGSIEEAATPVKGYWAVYPYDPANTCDGESVTLTVPSVLTAKEGTFADGQFPAIARSDNLDLAFYFVCGGIRFSVANRGIQSITFKSNGGEPLAGKVKVGFDSDGKPEIKQVLDGQEEVVVNAPDGDFFVPGKYYFVTMIPQTLPLGLSVSFRASPSPTISNRIQLVVSRGRFARMEGIDRGYELYPAADIIMRFDDSRVESIILSNTRWDENSDGQFSCGEAAVVSNLKSVFTQSNISSFNELGYFAGLTSIGNKAFFYCTSLTSIVLPFGVTSIEEGAFHNCSSLTSIEFPSGLTRIETDAFYSCSSLTSVELPSGLTSIGNRAFYKCSGLTSIVFPSGLTSIEGSAFSDCDSLISLELPSGLTSIGEGAFSSCYSLTSIEFPSGLTSIGEGAFSSCYSLTSIELPSGLISIEGYTFDDCRNLASIELPSCLTSIGYHAFYYCRSLTGIQLPSCLTSIASGAFYGCTSLTNIRSLNPTPPSIGSSVFPKTCEILVPAESVSLYKSAWPEYESQIKSL